MANAAVVTAKWNGVKVFSATRAQDRDKLGETVTDWVKHAKVDVVETVVTQSSDSEFHCLAITLFYATRGMSAFVDHGGDRNRSV